MSYNPMMIFKIIAWPICWMLFRTAQVLDSILDLIGHLEGRWKPFIKIIARAYQWAIKRSYSLQEAASGEGTFPWG
jgi:hypothetical protein